MKDQYISFSALQLAGESDFIAWVTEDQYDHEWSQWLDRHPEAQFNIEEARRIVHDVTAATTLPLMPADRQAMWNRISSQLNTSTARPKQFKLLTWRWAGLAAAAIALIFWITTWNKPTTILALAGEHKEIQLPEKSEVRLNAGSSVTYNGRSFTSDREIHLKGEAFFKVQHGSRFTVVTEQGNVTVLGTSFNVIAWPDRFEVSCYTGKVKVTADTQNELLITPGLRCTKNAPEDRLVQNTFDASGQTPEWTNGKFVFEDQPLQIVIEELQRQYNIQVNVEAGIGQLRYTGLFESGDLEKALYLVTWPLHLRSTIKGTTVSITR